MNAGVKSRRSYSKFGTLRTVEYSHCGLYGFFVVAGTALSLISCISSVDSSPNFFFLPSIVCRRNLASIPAKNCMPSSNFHIRSNAGIMAGNRDTVNQSES